MSALRTSVAFPIVISGPSGVGKTTVIERLVAADPLLCASISATTRPPRAGEVSGRDYFFVVRDVFDQM
ncbi:MAG: 50S ribosome-binding GTPase, partial [Candidatus Krumholzibacteria bacterium]|nr:50S ribosome-binding GTPase [Candidatus Krumholzibacteria bacterium]